MESSQRQHANLKVDGLDVSLFSTKGMAAKDRKVTNSAGTQSPFYSFPFKPPETSRLVTLCFFLFICQLKSIFISHCSFISITWAFHFGCLHQFLQFIGPFPHLHCRGSTILCSLVPNTQSYKPSNKSQRGMMEQLTG